MKDLIEALQIFLTYGDVANPTNCDHDELGVFPAVPPEEISPEHMARLEELSFTPNEFGGFSSFRFGSC